MHYEHQIKLIRCDKDLMDMALMYVPIGESTNWGINIITCTIITLYHPCNTAFANDMLEIKEIFPNGYEFVGDHHISTADTVYEHYNGPFGLVSTY